MSFKADKVHLSSRIRSCSNGGLSCGGW